jgi:hypothetical protein
MQAGESETVSVSVCVRVCVCVYSLACCEKNEERRIRRNMTDSVIVLTLVCE